MKFAIQHQHYWDVDKNEKALSAHTKVIDLADNLEEANSKLKDWNELKDKAFANMSKAYDILHTKFGIPKPDLGNWHDEMTIQNVPDDTKADVDEAQHIMFMGMVPTDLIVLHVMAGLTNG